VNCSQYIEPVRPF